MDTVTAVNIGLGIFWATLFVYLVHERRKVQFMRMMLNDDFRILAYRINKLRRVWPNMGRVITLYEKYEVTTDDREEIKKLYAMIIDLMEEESYGEQPE